MPIKVRSILKTVLLLVSASVLSVLIGLSSDSPNLTHILLGYLIIFFAIGMSIRKPAVALYVVLMYLPFMGLIRRYLIIHLGLLSLDPFVLIAPVVVLLLGSFWFYRYLVTQGLTFRDTKLFRLVRWFILVEVLEVANPLQHGITIGLSGLIFYLVPLFWMILSRFHFNEKAIKRIVYSVLVVAVIVALYGLKQTYFGFYPFEQKWVRLVGYTSLYVGNKVRAFSTPDNAQEYGVYLSIGIAIAWVCVLRGRFILKVIGLSCLGIMGFALFMESARGPTVLSIFALGITSILSANTARSRIFVSVLSLGAITGAFVLIGHMAVSSQNALVSHQLTGLAHPLNSKDSSLGGHSQRMFSGIIEGFKMPVGHGLGSTTTGAGKFNVQGQGTEVDISNVFVSDGIAGGILYLSVLGQCLWNSVRALRHAPFLSLITIGVLIAGAGQILNGGLYSTSAVTWVLVGYIDRVTALYRSQKERPEKITATGSINKHRGYTSSSYY